jgi:hypothetical protein
MCANSCILDAWSQALGDIYIWLPNGIGLVLSAAQIALACVYPSRPKAAAGGSPSQLHEA